MFPPAGPASDTHSERLRGLDLPDSMLRFFNASVRQAPCEIFAGASFLET